MPDLEEEKTYMIQSVAKSSSIPFREASKPVNTVMVIMIAPPGIPGIPITEHHVSNLPNITDYRYLCIN